MLSKTKAKSVLFYSFVSIVFMTIFMRTAAFSSPTLRIDSADILPGGKADVSIHLNDGNQSYAGVNLQIFLPQGVNVQNVNKGELLSDNFQIFWRTLDSDNSKQVSIITYASDDTISETDGILFNLALSVDNQLCRTISLINFSDHHYNPKVNVSHAISNNDGSQSIDHNVVTGKLRVNWGDLNCDQEITVEDAIIVLQTLSGFICDASDVDIENVGLEEAIYIFNQAGQ
jgi:hypothetical protein